MSDDGENPSSKEKDPTEIQSIPSPPTESGETADESQIITEEPEITHIEPPKSDLASFILMWFLIIAIAFLIHRRLKKHNIDLVELFYANFEAL